MRELGVDISRGGDASELERSEGTPSASAVPSKASVYDESRIYDVKAPGPNVDQYRKLKFGPDPVIKAEIVKDRHIIGILLVT